MDPRIEHELHKIGESTEGLQKKAMKFVKDEFHEEQIEQAHDILRRTEKTTSNAWNLKENEDARKAAQLVLGRQSGDHHEIDPRVAKEIDRVLETRVRQAIQTGRIKPANRREYQSYLRSIQKKR